MHILSKRFDCEIMNYSNEVLLCDLSLLAKTENINLSRFLAYIQEISHRGLHVEKGYSHLSPFLQEVLGLSEDEAMKRIQASRLCRRFPYIYQLIEEGYLNLSVLCRLSRHLTEGNHRRILDEAKGKSVREVERLIVREFPKTSPEDKIRKTALPLSIDRYWVQFTTDSEGVALLEKAKALLSRKYPEGKLNDIYKEALSKLIEELEPKRAKRDQTEKEQRKEPSPAARQVTHDERHQITSRYIPKHVRGEAWEDAKACCQYVSALGKRCGETKFLEFDHVFSWADGGSSKTASNIRILCRNHNAWFAKVRFGERVNLR